MVQRRREKGEGEREKRSDSRSRLERWGYDAWSAMVLACVQIIKTYQPTPHTNTVAAHGESLAALLSKGSSVSIPPHCYAYTTEGQVSGT
jgi:hypothetical protein